MELTVVTVDWDDYNCV